MRSAGIYLVQAEIGTCKLTTIPQGDISIALRVGKSSASTNHTQLAEAKQTNFNAILQLNVDNTGLQTQRCSITLTHHKQNQKKPLGIALISLPKDKSMIQNVYRLTQTDDKKSQLEVKIKISLLDSNINSRSKNLPLNSTNSINKQDTITETMSKNQQSKSQSKILRNDSLNNQRLETSSEKPSGIKIRSKVSENEQIEQPRKNLKGFKIKDSDKLMSITESQMKAYKDEKEAYYQLYQIEKTKSEAANKFIQNIIKKIGTRYPDLISLSSGNLEKKISKVDNTSKEKPMSKTMVAQQQAQTIAKLEQANRSLHRQNEQYKKIVDQLKGALQAVTKGGEQDIKGSDRLSVKRTSIANYDLYEIAGSNTMNNKSSIKDKDKKHNFNILPSNILGDQKKSTPNTNVSNLNDIDFKKWLELSIGQRDNIQKLLQKFPQKLTQKEQKSSHSLQKLRTNIDKVFILFLNKKEVNKDILLGHKQEISRLIDEINT